MLNVNANASTVVRESAGGVALLGTAAMGLFVCPYAGVAGFLALLVWGHRLADASERLLASRLKRTSVV